MLTSLLLSLLATQLSDFEVATIPAEGFESFGENSPTDEPFFDDRIADYSWRARAILP